jgi:hypothetical protein
MNTEKEYQSEMEALIEDALRQAPETGLPQGFTDRMMEAMGKRIFWQEMIMEFGYKCLIAIGALLVFGLIFFFISVKELSLLQSYLMQNRVFITGLLIAGLFILFTDQFFLKYLFKRQRGR